MAILSRKVCEYIAYGILFVAYYGFKYVKCATEVVDGGDKHEVVRYQVAQFNFDHVSDVYAITLWILLGSLAKVGKKRNFHIHMKMNCVLI